METLHQEKPLKFSNFIDFLALEYIILKSKVQKFAKYYYKEEKLGKVRKVSKATLIFIVLTK